MERSRREEAERGAQDAAESGLGVPCYEAQADGVPCDQLKSDCADCEKVLTDATGVKRDTQLSIPKPDA